MREVLRAELVQVDEGRYVLRYDDTMSIELSFWLLAGTGVIVKPPRPKLLAAQVVNLVDAEGEGGLLALVEMRAVDTPVREVGT
ncbi:hypothetical protein H1235_02150 [Pseudoxanthomonas sp. NC8]|nr:hypothetical protein H1235_02150 [Pseudoxanthomonas sp. NC8]